LSNVANDELLRSILTVGLLI